MPDYQKMYHTMVWAAEQCIQLLADAERACEELYLNEEESEREEEKEGPA